MGVIFGSRVSQGRVNHLVGENRSAWGFRCSRIFGKSLSWSGWWDFGLGMHDRFMLPKNQKVCPFLTRPACFCLTENFPKPEMGDDSELGG